MSVVIHHFEPRLTRWKRCLVTAYLSPTLAINLMLFSAPEARGEGLIGLTRGFMYAGAPRVVASLWAVEDRATAELMKRFYEGMLSRGLTASAALRDAQLALRRDRRWSDPYYWGAFVLQGEWR